MNKDIKKGWVPRLRFPEFRAAGGWAEVTLSQLGELVSGLTYSPEDVRDSGLLVLRSSNVKNSEISLEDNVYVTQDIKGANLTRPDDILICVRNGSKGLIGKNALIPAGMPLCTHGAFMTVFRSQSAKFVFQLFQSAAYQNQVDADLGATINSINGSQFVKYKFIVPSAPEQQKVANCLASIDELISAQSQKVDALKIYKNGLLQQLFACEGQTIPRLRFPAFRDVCGWQLKKIGKVLIGVDRPINMLDDKRYSLVTVKRRYGGVVLRGLFKGETIKVKSQFLLKKNDFLISKRQIVHCACGLVPAELDGSIVSNEYSILVPRKGNDVVFFNYFAMQSIVENSFLRCSIGIVIEKMLFKLNDWLNQEFLFPDHEEQKKIATFLVNVDKMIVAQTQKLEALKTHKKGLMQALFPAPDEVEA